MPNQERSERSVCLVACGKSKTNKRSPARHLYTSSLFKQSRRYSSTYFRDWYILSARHGLVKPESNIAPYDESLLKMSKSDRLAWTVRVVRRIKELLPHTRQFTILGGAAYWRELAPALEKEGCDVSTPLAGKPIGLAMQWLNRRVDNVANAASLDELYRLLNEFIALRQAPRLGDMTNGIAEQGVYLFFDDREARSRQPTMPRIVRVGTHAA
jgi:hypothetical protein